MKKYSIAPVSMLGLIILLFSSCIKDQCVRTYSFYKPVYQTTEAVRASIGSEAMRPVEHPGKIYVRGQYIFLNEMDRGIHIIDNSQPSNPRSVSFIKIPGNIDMAVKGNTLYADAYTDLVVMDIRNPLSAVVKKIVSGVFPFRYYGTGFAGDPDQVIVDWEKRDTTLETDCGSGGFFGLSMMKQEMVFAGGDCLNCRGLLGASSGGQSPFGLGGSMARFAIMNNHLYTVSTSHLNVFGIANAFEPVQGKDIPLSWNIETIYPFKDRLFIGSNAGMYLFSVANPDDPTQIGRFEHARACDPVVGDDNHAYVTLRSGTECEGFNNQLDIVDVKNPLQAALVKTYQMKNPHGLSKDGNLLFICDGAAGLKVYDATDVQNLKLLSVVPDIETYDVIAFGRVAIVTAKGGLYQYDYADPSSLKLLSRMQVPY